MFPNRVEHAIVQHQEICLSHLINFDHHVHGGVHVIITIAPQILVTIFDDLHDHGFLHTKIEFILQERVTLAYFMKATDQVLSQSMTIEKEIIVQLEGRYASANITCAYLGVGQKVFIFKSLQNHHVEQTTSNVVVKSVLDDESKLFCYSLIHVDKQAQHAVAEQVNKNIVLKNTAHVVSVPMLEVLAHDVRCKHGAAVSTLDTEQLFYLQSRGIDKNLTRQMLIQAFLN